MASNPRTDAAGVGDGQRRSCYVNFAGHLLNAYNPNVLHADLPGRWSDEDWYRFVDMIAAFGFNCFDFWLVPSLFSPAAVGGELGQRFARQMAAVIEHAADRSMSVKMLCCLSTVGPDWHTHCPNVKEEWDQCLGLWRAWIERLPGLGVVGIFPGDPGGCVRHGCTAYTYIDKAREVAEVVKSIQPRAEIELGTWGSPFFGWGNLQAPPNWQGQFIQSIQHTAWTFDRHRADDAMDYLTRRLPQFPADTSVAINMAFNSDSDPDLDGGRQDARPWAREIGRTNRIVTWDFSLTEGENAVFPHCRFERLFAQRRREREAAPYRGGICFTMTPLLNQLSLHHSARSFLDPDADHRALTRQFLDRLLGPQAADLAELLPLFEIVPDWGNRACIELSREGFHRRMGQGVELLRALVPRPDQTLPFHPSADRYRQELLFFFELFADLSGPRPDFHELHQRYWRRVYAIYDHLPPHVDPRPHQATARLIGLFDPSANTAGAGPLPAKWAEA